MDRDGEEVLGVGGVAAARRSLHVVQLFVLVVQSQLDQLPPGKKTKKRFRQSKPVVTATPMATRPVITN